MGTIAHAFGPSRLSSKAFMVLCSLFKRKGDRSSCGKNEKNGGATTLTSHPAQSQYEVDEIVGLFGFGKVTKTF